MRYLHLEPIDWQPDADFPGRAWPQDEDTILLVSHLCLHLYALQVEEGEGEQRAANPHLQTELEGLQDLTDGPVQTVALPGLEGRWALAATPFGR
ncbi:MAG: hypothetical protein ABIL09_12580 [Gemmatimonadota bacterium]